MKKTKKVYPEDIRYYYVTGIAIKDGLEYRVGRTLRFELNENVIYETVYSKFVNILNEQGFDCKFMWGWSLCEKNN